MRIRLYAVLILLLSISFNTLAQNVYVCDQLSGGTNSLQSYVRGATVTNVNMLGYAAPGDGGGGRFVWVAGSIPGSAPAPSTGSVFVAAAAGSGTGYWRREIDGNAVNALWFGLKAEYTNTSVSAVQVANNVAFTNTIAAAAYLQMKAYLPGTQSGYAYHFDTTLVLNKPIELYGDFGAKNTELRVKTGRTGMQVKNGGYVFPISIRNISLQYGFSPDAYHPTPNLLYNGFDITTIVNLEGVQAIGFPGDGFKLIGLANGTTPYSDVSKSVLINCSSGYNGNNGFYTEGPEANNIHFEQCNATGNYFWGIYDKSFLGNTYTTCHTAYNGKFAIMDTAGTGLGNPAGGGYKTEGGTNYSRLLGCYSELADVQSVLSGKTILVGGFAENEGQALSGGDIYKINGGASAATVFADQGRIAIRPGFVVPGSLHNIEAGTDGVGIRAQYGTTGDAGTYFMTFNNTSGYKYAAYRYANGGDIIGLTGNATPSTIFGFAAGKNVSARFIVPGGVNLTVDNNRLNYRNLRFGTAAPTGGTTEYAAGDFILNTDYTNGTVVGWRCSATGTPGTWQEVRCAAFNTAQNGLSVVSGNIELGGSALTHNSTIDLSTFNLDLTAGGTAKIGFSNDASAGGVIKLNANPFLFAKGAGSVFLGQSSGNLSNTGSNNTSVGNQSLTALTTGWGNASVGTLALNANTTGAINTAVGWNAMLNTNTGAENVAIGGEAMKTNTTGGLDVAVGRQAMVANTTGWGNTAIGMHSLESNTTGTINTSLGGYSGKNATTGSYNVYIGVNSGPAAGGPVTASNKLYISSTAAATTSPLIGGDFFQGRVGINKDVTTLLFNLDVNGTGRYANGVIIGAPSYTTYANAWSAGYNCLVKGKLGAEELVVLAYASWPDYVFEKNYKLLSLQEVEAYIKAHNHLPGVTSAEEMKSKDGIEVGKMQTKLLEKIEELTLYAIEADKKNAAANDKISQLEKRLSALEKLVNTKQ